MSKLRGNWKVRDCSDRVEDLLALYNQRSGDDDQTRLSDLLCDLMHFAYRHRLDFGAALSSAENNAEAEQVPSFSEGR